MSLDRLYVTIYIYNIWNYFAYFFVCLLLNLNHLLPSFQPTRIEALSEQNHNMICSQFWLVTWSQQVAKQWTLKSTVGTPGRTYWRPCFLPPDVCAYTGIFSNYVCSFTHSLHSLKPNQGPQVETMMVDFSRHLTNEWMKKKEWMNERFPAL